MGGAKLDLFRNVQQDLVGLKLHRDLVKVGYLAKGVDHALLARQSLHAERVSPQYGPLLRESRGAEQQE